MANGMVKIDEDTLMEPIEIIHKKEVLLSEKARLERVIARTELDLAKVNEKLNIIEGE